ncbi:SusC/RagA family TonB-linked outer membrane protein [Chitinophaga horti]|uniref:SusC/RagA family TonB-linked outer membrane protein n=1 Tax=Chitinophaga horti TaxID=2920382 RepID=A0ABY6JC70_9BACT|nr:SusC/RagA family TonB-linked outer membrane protein [Chitinophaga horti]UYQ95799.1 SusC/RagA family TonB-linked outer membrane protein [Chitinophaga horti]
MKLLTLLLTTAILQVSASSHAQNVRFTGKNVPLKSVFSAVEQQTGYVFFYDADLLKLSKPVTTSAATMPLPAFLSSVLADQPLEYEIRNKTIFINKKEQLPAAPAAASPPPPFVLKGDVTGPEGPLVGASVKVKGTSRGATVGIDGKFSLDVNVGEVLVITFLGYQPREIRVADTRPLSIRMAVSETAIKDVVVTGMFTRKADTYTGATTTFSKDDLMKVGSVNVLQSLRNLEPSMLVIDNNDLGSNPNALPDIQIRGQSGLPDIKGEYQSNPNLPLFILDGFETTLQKVVDLDINRVKSITMLKDAASKAIYGSRAANGVVVIETERPKPGKVRLTYNSNVNIQTPDLTSYNLTNAREKLEVELAGGVYTGTTPQSNYLMMQDYNAKLAMVESGINTDWLSKPLRNSVGQRHSLRLEGGDLGFRYGIDLMYNNVKGVMKGSDRNTLSGAIDLSYRVRTFSFNNILTITDNKGYNSNWGAFSQYAYMNPYLPFYDDNGRILKEISNFRVLQGGGGAGATTVTAVYNPAYNATLKMRDDNAYTDITNNFSVDWTIVPGLRATGRFNLTKQLTQADVFKPADHTDFTSSVYAGDEAFRKGSYSRSNGKQFYYTANVLLAYTKSLGKHLLNLNGGGELNNRQNDAATYIVEGFPNDRLDEVTMALQYMKDSRPTGFENTVRDLSAIVSGNYSYDERYLADFSYRATRSSQLGTNNPWGNLWSVGVGWNLHHEAFIKSLGAINQFRLRGSTGYTGTQSFSSYISMATYVYYLDKSYNGANGAYLMGLDNPDLGWQRRQDNNIGIDLGLFKSLNMRLDYYVSNTDGFITDITMPLSSGFYTYKANLGKLQNKGFDVRFDYRLYYNTQTRNAFNVFFNVSHNKNILKQLSNSLRSFNDEQDSKGYNTNLKDATIPRVRFVEGQSVNTIWAVQSLGIDPATGRELYLSRDGKPVFDWNAADQIAAGDALPKLNGNFGFNAAWAGFNFTTSFRFQTGGQIYNQTLVDKVENADIRRNVDKRVSTDRWRNPGDVSFFKNIANTVYTQVSTRFVEDDNKLTLGVVNLTYDLDRLRAVKAAGFSRLRVGFNTAEVFTSSTVRVERGISYPFARSYNFTLSASL